MSSVVKNGFELQKGHKQNGCRKIVQSDEEVHYDCFTVLCMDCFNKEDRRPYTITYSGHVPASLLNALKPHRLQCGDALFDRRKKYE